MSVSFRSPPEERTSREHYLVRFKTGQYVANCRIGSGYMTYDRTYSRENAHRFYKFDSELVLKRLAEKGEAAEREHAVRRIPDREQFEADISKFTPRDRISANDPALPRNANELIQFLRGRA